MNKNKYMLIYWWGYNNNSNDNKPFVEWIEKNAEYHSSSLIIYNMLNIIIFMFHM